MKNIFIFGSGRSGTSMLAGLFSRAGYHMGEELYPGRDTNPKGFFESSEINSLNESIIKYNLPSKLTKFFSNGYNHKLSFGQYWLANFESRKSFKSSFFLNNCIQLECKKDPFCYKDPRFSYTYPLWKPFAGDHVCLVIFRNPSKTIESMVKEIKKQDYLQNYHLNLNILNEIWFNQYSSILNSASSNFFFIHYDQVFQENSLMELKSFVGCKELLLFQDKDLDRSTGKKISVQPKVDMLYEKLCQLANYSKLP